MTSKKAYSPKDLSPQVQDLCDVLNREGDLACALVGVSFLDEALAVLLRERMIPSSVVSKALGPTRWLGSFAARTELCYCLGLIPKGLFQNLGQLGQLRNKLAHSHLQMDFRSPDAVELVEKLTLPTMQQNFGEPVDLESLCGRERFKIVVILMANRLLLTGLGAEAAEPKVKGW